MKIEYIETALKFGTKLLHFFMFENLENNPANY